MTDCCFVGDAENTESIFISFSNNYKKWSYNGLQVCIFYMADIENVKSSSFFWFK